MNKHRYSLQISTIRHAWLLFLAGGILTLFSASAAAADKKFAREQGIIRAGLADTDRDVRGLAARYEGQVGDKDGMDGLKALLNDPVDSVKIKAAVALDRLGDRSGISDLRRIAATATKLSENPTPLERMRAITKGTARAEAVQALGEIKDYDSMPLLKRLVEDDDGRVADAALISLARLGDASVKRRFVIGLESDKQGVRAKSADALGEIGDMSNLPDLRKHLKDWDRDTKIAAALAVGKLRDRDSVPQLKELLNDKNDLVREKAAMALGMIGDLGVLPDLKKALSDPNGFVRIAAAESLHLLGDDSGKDFLVKVLKTDDKDARLRALDVLGKVGKSGDSPAMEPLLSDPDKTVSISAAKAIILTGKR